MVWYGRGLLTVSRHTASDVPRPHAINPWRHEAEPVDREVVARVWDKEDMALGGVGWFLLGSGSGI